MSNLYGLIGEKLGHSLSPEIHSLILERINKKGSYSLFEITKENLAPALIRLKALEVKGVNVTIPYKIDILKYLDKTTIEAEKIGAVNTISFNDGILTGYNTDYSGFGASLKKAAIEVKNKRIVVLGTGGVSKAVEQFLINNEAADIIFVSRNSDKSLNNMNSIKVISYNDLNNLGTSDIIINCTPCGMYPNVEASPVGKAVLSHFSTAIDLIYNPKETLFLREASETGLKTLNGLYMLVAQAIAAQEIWNNVKISNEAVDEIYYKIESKLYGDKYE
jgi:shikimate dehydrogenase